jgi:membrane peptidoglycan carboxypeptidase
MSPVSPPRNVLGLLGAFMVTSLVAGVLAAGLFLPAVGAAGLTASKSVDFFDSLPGDLSQPPLSEQSKMLAADGTVIARFFDENRQNVSLKEIALPMQRAVIAIEDSRFYQHGGIDPKGLARAFVVNKVSGKVEQGASTLTQQYVKNVLVEAATAAGDKAAREAANEQTNARKLREIRYAVSLEKKMTKDQILNNYLNIVWFGGKTYGVKSAAKHYFNTSPQKLTLPQAATLAGMVQDPPKFNPINNPKDSLARRNIVLRVMRDQGIIDQTAYQEAVATKIKTDEQPDPNGCANAEPQYAWYCDYVYRLIIRSKDFSALGKTEKARGNAIARGGLTIQTSMDKKTQNAAWDSVTKKLPPKDKSKVGSATVSVEPGTGKVTAIAQNRLFNPAGGRGASSINWSVDNAYGGGNGFQTGSTFKPFTLATWLKDGKSLYARVNASAGTASYSEFKACGKKLSSTQPYTYSNASDGKGQGTMSVFDATAKSVNGAYVSMEKQLDLCDIRTTAESIGVHLAKKRNDICKLDATTVRLPECAPALTLGIENISPMTMAAAYAAFAAEGKYCKPTAVSTILDREKNKLKVPGGDCKQALDTKVANTVNFGLSRALKDGTASSVGQLPGGRPASGKTGTTNNSTATWFVGYTPQLATAVWVGDAESAVSGAPKSLNGRQIGGRYYGSVYGATIAGPIWKKIMEKAMQGKPVERFAKADSSLLERPTVGVPDVSGKSLQDAMQILQTAGFSPQPNGGFVNSAFPAGSVAKTDPPAGSDADRGATITISVSNGQPETTNPLDDLLEGQQDGGNGGNGGDNNGNG